MEIHLFTLNENENISIPDGVTPHFSRENNFTSIAGVEFLRLSKKNLRNSIVFVIAGDFGNWNVLNDTPLNQFYLQDEKFADWIETWDLWSFRQSYLQSRCQWLIVTALVTVRCFRIVLLWKFVWVKNHSTICWENIHCTTQNNNIYSTSIRIRFA